MATPLDNERYVSLETFKKDGGGVKTPVWAAPLDGKLVIFTDGESFKVKRLGRNPSVRVAACDSRGGSINGPWYEGTGRIVEDAATGERILEALKKKYGWQMIVAHFFSTLSGRAKRRKYLELTLAG